MEKDGESNLCDLKLKNSEQIGVKLNENRYNCNIHAKQAMINKSGNKIRIL